MAGISFDGVTSGLDTTSIIESMMQSDSRQKIAIEQRKEANMTKIEVWKQVSASLISLQIDSYALSRPTLFNTMNISSSDDSSIAANVTGSALEGSYTMEVKKLAQSHQLLSNGYDDSDSTYVGAGSMTFEFGNGKIDPATKLDFINGQDGFKWGAIKVTDRSGGSATVDLTDVTEIKEVMDKINRADGINVTASVNSDGTGLDIVDNTGVTATSLKIEDVNGGTTASSLGILGTAVGDTLNGSDIYYIQDKTKLSLINDGLGVRTESGNDLRITVGATDVDVDLSTAKTIADVSTLIETAGSNAGVTLDVQVNTDGNGININSSSGNITAISALNSSEAINDLGLNGLALGGASVSGGSLIGGIDTVMLKNLNGGSGIDLTNDIVLNLADASTVTVTSAELTGAVTLDDIMDLIESKGGSSLDVSKNIAGNGISIKDNTSGLDAFSIDDNTTTATLGINVASSSGVIDGNNLEFKYISENTLLETLNSGEGIDKGNIKVTNSIGSSVEVELSGSDINSIGDVIDELNLSLSSLSITARVNDSGDGILLEDSSGGSSDLKVEDVSGSAAKDLNLLGSGSGSIDGAMEYTVEVAATDTLEDLRDKINNASIDVKASIINDGSMSGAYKLMLTSSSTGENGHITIDSSLSGGLGLDFSTIANAQNSVISLGSSGVGSSSSVMYKSSNNITDVLQGVSLDLKSVSEGPVSLTLNNDYSSISSAVGTYVETFNSLVDLIDAKTDYDPETGASGELQGDYTVNEIKAELYEIMSASVEGLPSEMNNIAQAGLTFDLSGKLTLDDSELSKALQNNLDGVEKLFNYSINIGASTNNTVVTGSTADVGYSLSGAIDGNNKFTSFDDQTTGYQTSVANGWMQFDFEEKYNLQKFVLYSMDSSGFPADDYALKSFDVEYWDSVSSGWENARSYERNSSGKVVSYFSDSITTDKVRINNMNGQDGISRVTEFEVYEARGIASRINDLTKKVTELGDGSIALATENIYDNNDILDQQVDTWDARLARKEQYYREQFTQMEAVMAQFQAQQSWLSTQLGSLDSGWSLRNK